MFQFGGSFLEFIKHNLIWLLIAFLSLGSGCAGKNLSFEQKQQHLANSLDALRQARFKGSIRFNEGGSILGINYGMYGSLGPQQVTLMVEGDVDFTQTPRIPE